MGSRATRTDEAERLTALAGYAILDTEAEAAFDDLVQVAARLCATPVALLSLVDRERLWFKARVGVAAAEMPRGGSFCERAIAHNRPFVVMDARTNSGRSATSPTFDASEFCFYAGATLRAPSGYALGTLCVMDRAPRLLDADKLQLLELLAQHAMGLLEARKRTRALELASVELERTRALARAMIEHSADAVALIGPDNRFRYASPSTTRVLGYAPQELVGKDVFALVHEDDIPRCREFLALTLSRAGVPARVEFRCRHRNGAWRHIEADGVGRLGDPAVDAVIVNYRDITERRRTEARLSESEERFRQLADNIGAMFWIRETTRTMHDHPRFLYANQAYEMLSGRPVQALLDDPATMTEAILPDDREAVRCARLQANECPCEVEFRLRHVDDSLRWVRARAFPIRDRDGVVRRIAGISEDITERKAAEDTLQQFFVLARDLLCIANYEGYYQELSQGWTQSLGWSLEELKSRPFIEFVHPEDKASTIAEGQLLQAAGQTIEFENRYLCKDGSYRWLSWSASTLPEKRLYFAAARDVTERRRTEDALRRHAHFDPLTDLPNRAALDERLTRVLERCRREPSERCAALFLDLDGFKLVNDEFGHEVGDELLIAAARRIEITVRPGDFVARVGGDEFVIVLEHTGEPCFARAIADRVEHALATSFMLSVGTITIAASVGIAMNQPQHEARDLLRDADTEMYRAKAAARRLRAAR